jgi:hypothetical protein
MRLVGAVSAPGDYGNVGRTFKFSTKVRLGCLFVRKNSFDINIKKAPDEPRQYPTGPSGITAVAARSNTPATNDATTPTANSDMRAIVLSRSA